MQDKVTLLRNKWAEALESGEYQQHHGSYFPYGNRDREGTLMCANAVLWRVSRSMGFDDIITRVADNINIISGRITSDNDRRRLSFPEIAAKLRNGEYNT